MLFLFTLPYGLGAGPADASFGSLVFGGLMPVFPGVFLILNISLLEIGYRINEKKI